MIEKEYESEPNRPSTTAGRFSRYLLYALGEIILVMIGILLALQVNNWNETNKERKFTAKLLDNLREELIQDSIYFSNVYEVERTLFLRSAEVLFQVHSSREQYSDNDSILAKAFRFASFAPVIKYSDNAYKELSSTNLLDQLSHTDLKKDLYEYYGQINFLNRYSEQNYAFTNDLIQELANYYIIIPMEGPDQRKISDFAGAAESDFTSEYDLESFRQNKSLNSKLYDMIDIHKDRLGGLENIRDLSRGIMDKINKELKN